MSMSARSTNTSAAAAYNLSSLSGDDSMLFEAFSASERQQNTTSREASDPLAHSLDSAAKQVEHALDAGAALSRSMLKGIGSAFRAPMNGLHNAERVGKKTMQNIKQAGGFRDEALVRLARAALPSVRQALSQHFLKLYQKARS